MLQWVPMSLMTWVTREDHTYCKVILLLSCKDMRTVIVGAGIAGLWLAEQLALRGEAVTVLEKYNYLGGRWLTSKYGYELGSGRIHATHHRVHELIKRLGLHSRPISPEIAWMSEETKIQEPIASEAVLTPYLDRLRQLSSRTLGTHTIKELLVRILGSKQANALLMRYPYRGETEVLRADLALETFADGNEMGTHEGYSGITEGFSELIRRLAASATAAGAVILTEQEVTGIQAMGKVYRVHVKGQTNQTDQFQANRVIMATHVTALRHIYPFRAFESLRHLQMTPLTRIYAKYPRVLFDRIQNTSTVTDSPLRYIIPIHAKKGIIMISYTESQDTKVWTHLKGEPLKEAIHAAVEDLFSDTHIPEPEWVRSIEWSEGCTYWRPGDYDPVAASRAAMRPFPEHRHLHLTGESFSLKRQAWAEGALEHAAMLLRNL